MVSKFPVIGKYGEYKVEIEHRYEDDYGNGEYPFLVATVIGIGQAGIFKLKAKRKYKYIADRGSYDAFSEDLVTFAKIAVMDYEGKNKSENKAEIEFKKWDGQVY